MKINRFISNILISGILVGALLVTGCGNKNSESVDEGVSEVKEDVEVLFITDYGTVKDGSFNQEIWRGVDAFQKETGIVCDYYSPDNTDTESYLNEIDKGVKNGAKVIISSGYMLEYPFYEAQSKYADIKFILVDGIPHNEDYSEEGASENTLSITFAEEQAGFLAGYAAVREGYTKLGFLGGIAEDSVVKFGYGFVQGADYAAIEMGETVDVRYVYANTYEDDAEVENIANTWYSDDTEVIFACGGSIGKGVMKIAEQYDKKVIGVDADQSSDSTTVITSAVKELSGSVYNALKTYSEGSFTGGFTKVLEAADNGVSLPMNTSRFEKFTQEDYEKIYNRLKEGLIVPYKGTDIGTTQELTLINTTINYIVME